MKKIPISVLIIVYTKNKNILLLNKKGKDSMWQSITGSLQINEKPLDAAKRELFEETGIKVEDYLLQRQRQIQKFGSIVINFSVPGNSSRHVGDLVRFEIPSTIPDDDPNLLAVPFGHQLYSGYYIVSKIRHIIDTQGYQTDIELIKNSFAKRLPGQEEELSTDGTGG